MRHIRDHLSSSAKSHGAKLILLEVWFVSVMEVVDNFVVPEKLSKVRKADRQDGRPLKYEYRPLVSPLSVISELILAFEPYHHPHVTGSYIKH